MTGSGLRSGVYGMGILVLSFLLTLPCAFADVIQRPDLQSFFKEYDVEGSFVIAGASDGELIIVNRTHAETPAYPASTFKIFNALIALETGVVKDGNEILPYGGQPQPFKSWQRDMNLGEAIAVSNVAIFQGLAKKIGLHSYESWLERINYGNGSIGSSVRAFWLRGPLKISAVEQVLLLGRLLHKELPFSDRNIELVRGFLQQPRLGEAEIFAKTGWSNATEPQIGWYVGWLEMDSRQYPFALRIEIEDRADANKRKPLARALLRHIFELE